MNFTELFKTRKPLIACVHLLPLPGAPNYNGDMDKVYETALSEVEIYKRYAIDGLIVENFRDMPFYPDRIPAETVAAMAAVTREIVKNVDIPVGVNALRNDAQSGIAITTATEADFIRVNVHTGAVVADQGIVQAASHLTLRLRSTLRSKVLIFADVGVKHSAPLADRGLAAEAKDTVNRGLADALVVSGRFTGSEISLDDIETVRETTQVPVIVGSGVTPENLDNIYKRADGFIVGSNFKKGGKAENFVEESRVEAFCEKIKSLQITG